MTESITLPPLALRYLKDVDRLLSGIDPAERSEVLDGLREHLAATLPADAADDEVRAALAEVGSPETVAEEAYAGRAGAGPLRLGPPKPLPRTSRPWLPLVAVVFQALAVYMAHSAADVLRVMVFAKQSPGGGETTTEFRFYSSLSGFAVGLVGSAPFWIAATVLVALCGLWSIREKLTLIAVVPALAVALGFLPIVGHALFGIPGVYAAEWVTLGLTIFGAGGVLVVLTRRALRRSAALSGQN